jgi:hypothetical protein
LWKIATISTLPLEARTVNPVFQSFRRGWSRFIGSQEAVVSPEYAVVLALLLGGIVLTLAAFGSHLSDSMSVFANTLSEDTFGAAPAKFMNGPLGGSASYTAARP